MRRRHGGTDSAENAENIGVGPVMTEQRSDMFGGYFGAFWRPKEWNAWLVVGRDVERGRCDGNEWE